MIVIPNRENLRIYMNDPFKKNCIAKFFKGNHVMNDESAEIRKLPTPTQIEISIGNGNHERDFDSVHIISQDNFPIFKIFASYQEFHQGYGEIYLTLQIPLELWNSF